MFFFFHCLLKNKPTDDIWLSSKSVLSEIYIKEEVLATNFVDKHLEDNLVSFLSEYFPGPFNLCHLTRKISWNQTLEYNCSNTNPDAKSLVNFTLSAPLNERVTIGNSRVTFLLNILKIKGQWNLIDLLLGMLFNLVQTYCNAKKRGNQVVLKKSR